MCDARAFSCLQARQYACIHFGCSRVPMLESETVAFLCTAYSCPVSASHYHTTIVASQLRPDAYLVCVVLWLLLCFALLGFGATWFVLSLRSLSTDVSSRPAIVPPQHCPQANVLISPMGRSPSSRTVLQANHLLNFRLPSPGHQVPCHLVVPWVLVSSTLPSEWVPYHYSSSCCTAIVATWFEAHVCLLCTFLSSCHC